MRAGNFVLYKRDTAADGVSWDAGIAVEFYELRSGDLVDFFMIACGHTILEQQNQPSSWLYSSTVEHVVVHHKRIFHVAPYVQDGAHVRVILPTYAKDIWR